MSVSALGHVNMRLPASLLDRVRDFYVGLLGLRVGARPPFRSTGYWLYAGDEPIVHLVEDDSIDGATARQSDIVDHIAFCATGYDSMLSRLEAAGVTCEKRRVPETAQRQLFMRDPAGVHIELLFDSVSDRQIGQ